MFQSHFGEFAALLTALFWTTTAMSFEIAGKRVGSLPVNLIRLVIGFGFLTLYSLFFRAIPFPTDASAHAWTWLAISGLIGFVIGDLLLFRAFVLIGSRISMLVMASVPPMTALIGWIFLSETLTVSNMIGMSVTIVGIALVVLRNRSAASTHTHKMAGYLCAAGGAMGQAVGLVMSKVGMGSYDAFAATQIRIIAGIVGFLIVFAFRNEWTRIRTALQDRRAMLFLTIGSFFGPFLGVSFSLLAVQNTSTGVASTIMAIVPVLIIPPTVIFFKESVSIREIAGAVIAVFGIALMFL